MPEIPEQMLREAAVDDLHYDLIQQLGLSSYMCVPLKGRDAVLGAITFVASDSGRHFVPGCTKMVGCEFRSPVLLSVRRRKRDPASSCFPR